MIATFVNAGGPVQRAPHVYIAYWGNWWNSTNVAATNAGWSYTPRDVRRYVTSFFAHIGASSWSSVLRQYGTRGAQLRGAYVDTKPVPAHPTSAQIQSEALRVAHHFRHMTPDTTVVVITSQGHDQRGNSACGYHDLARSLPFIYLPYLPDMPRCGRNSVAATAFGNGYMDGFSIIGGHELAETQSDPLFTGWYDPAGKEVGDMCAWRAVANVQVGGKSFAVQPLWSNKTQSCEVAA